jgi:hypothetical protein
MSTPLFEEIAPWYRMRVSQMVIVSFRIPESLRDAVLATPEGQTRGLGEFVRAALVEKLGLPPENLVAPPSRQGVGGWPKQKRNLPQPRAAAPDPIIEIDKDEPSPAATNKGTPPYQVSSTALTEEKKRALAKAGAMAAGVGPRAGMRPSDSTASTSGRTSEPSPPVPPDHSRESSAPASAPASRESRGSVVGDPGRSASLGGSRRKSSAPGKTSVGDQ